jgi:Na+:H+ antiporter, NhaA family
VTARDPRESEVLRVPWSRSDRPIPRRIVRPIQAFLETEASGGFLLLAAAVAALIWANSPVGGSYERVWHTVLTVGVGDWSIAEDLRHWVNDALMSIFFLVVGLEIKRELARGELSDIQAAALPVLAAVGGMVFPALLYLAFNHSGDAARGWGIPMATDIAFAIGVLAIVGRGLPSALRYFLLALAIVDDIGAIVVIAIFYSGHVEWPAMTVALGLIALIVGLQRLRVHWMPLYIALGVGVWLATFESGVHPTIAGVTLGLLTPGVPILSRREARRVALAQGERAALQDEASEVSFDEEAEWAILTDTSREAVSPLTRVERALHPWSSFLIVPVFALANAGVRLHLGSLDDMLTSGVALGVVVGLVVGKFVGILLGSWAGVRLRVARLPDGVTWSHVARIAPLAGIGFTVSLFIAGLAFTEQTNHEAAKLGILAASLVAGLIGALLLVTAPKEGAEPS